MNRHLTLTQDSNRQLWVRDLLTTAYPQGHGALVSDPPRRSLWSWLRRRPRVPSLCALAIGGLRVSRDALWVDRGHTRPHAFLPDDVGDQLGVTMEDMTILSRWNDGLQGFEGPMSFRRIADLIAYSTDHGGLPMEAVDNLRWSIHMGYAQRWLDTL